MDILMFTLKCLCALEVHLFVICVCIVLIAKVSLQTFKACDKFTRAAEWLHIAICVHAMYSAEALSQSFPLSNPPFDSSKSIE